MCRAAGRDSSAGASGAGDSQVRRAGRSTNLGVEFDVYWQSPEEMERSVTDAGFAMVFWGSVSDARTVARPRPIATERD